MKYEFDHEQKLKEQITKAEATSKVNKYISIYTK
jgi:hypothetical protein